jgi:hypothetical protein
MIPRCTGRSPKALTAERQRAAAMAPYPSAPAPAPPNGRCPEQQPATAFYGSTALVATLARVPARELPGLRMVLHPQFDLTPETTPPPSPAPPGTGPAGMRLGEVLDRKRIGCGDLTVPPTGINPLEPAAGPDGGRFALQAHADMPRRCACSSAAR